MTRKRLLNISSRKKRDTMLPASNSNATSAGGPNNTTTPLVAGAAVLTANNTYFFPWVATARDLTTDPNNTASTIISDGARTASTCFMRGLAERCEIQTNSGLSWQWRRICFTFKGNQLYSSGGTGYNMLAKAQTTGWSRLLQNWYNGSISGPTNNLTSYMFKGAYGVDWIDPLAAQLDNSRISVKYDKIRNFNSGNALGICRFFKMWHPMNHNIVYDDDEYGETKGISAATSTNSKAGMGDYYVVDYFRAGSGGTNADQLIFFPTATLYWHER